MKKIFLILCVLVSPQVVLAETIYLKDGNVIKGEILERSSYYLTVKEGNVPKKYFTQQIDRIEKDESPVDKVPIILDPEQIQGIPESKIRLIQSLMEVNGIRAAMEKNIEDVIANAPAEREDELRNIFNIESVLSTLAPVYDKYYTEDEIRQLVQFYQSPIGKKLLNVTPSIMQDVMDKSIEYFQKKTSP